MLKNQDIARSSAPAAVRQRSFDFPTSIRNSFAECKIISGASDITLLLNWVERAGVVSFMGRWCPTIRQGSEGYDRKLLLDLLQGRQAVRFPTDGTNCSAEGRGEAGSLAVACRWLFHPGNEERDQYGRFDPGAEDIDAKPYQIDRMMTHLKQAGKFEGVRGVVFREMLNCMQHPIRDTRRGSPGGSAWQVRVPHSLRLPTGTHFSPNVIVPFECAARLELRLLNGARL